MGRLLLVLSLGLLFCTGCSHANVTTRHASHGHLALLMDKNLGIGEPPSEESAPVSAPEVEVEPSQAPAVFAEAVQVLRGTPTEEQTRQAWTDLRGACEAELEEACVFLRDALQRPEKEEMAPAFPPTLPRPIPYAMTVIRCRIKTDGSVRDCEVLEPAPHGLTEAALNSLRTARFRPSMLAGHAVESPFVFRIRLAPATPPLTPEQKLEWARLRAEAFPRSEYAWQELAERLAELAPEAPAYVPSLRQLHALQPRNWWAANELAWMDVQAGHITEAAPLARQARKRAPQNPYVLETSAAVHFGQGQCEQAVAEQQRAVEKLPAEWPAPERERFLRALRDYQQRCPAGAPPAH